MRRRTLLKRFKIDYEQLLVLLPTTISLVLQLRTLHRKTTDLLLSEIVLTKLQQFYIYFLFHALYTTVCRTLLLPYLTQKK